MIRARSAIGNAHVFMFALALVAVACRTGSDQPGSEQHDAMRAAPVAEHASHSGALHDLDWLAGCWRGGEGSTLIEETWTEPAAEKMLATGRTVDVASGRTLAFEFLRIETRGDRLVYIALPNGRGETAFPSTKVEKDHLRFENPEHDDPKVIEYRLEADGTLVTRVEGARVEEVRLRRVW